MSGPQRFSAPCRLEAARGRPSSGGLPPGDMQSEHRILPSGDRASTRRRATGDCVEVDVVPNSVPLLPAEPGKVLSCLRRCSVTGREKR